MNNKNIKQKDTNVAFFVTWRIKVSNRDKKFLAIFESTRDTAAFIVRQRKINSTIQVYKAVRKSK